MIILIFGISSWAAGLAYVQEHCVAGIALPPADANIFFISILPLAGDWRRSCALMIIVVKPCVCLP